jgi:hypothetical protein
MTKSKRVQVITRDCNGEDIILMRKKVTLATWITLGIYRPWRDWKLENERKYELSEQLHSLVAKADKLLREYKDECSYIKQLKKEVAADTRATRGFSAPYPIEVPKKELPFAFHKHRTNPGEVWRATFSMEFLRKCGVDSTGSGSNKKTTRDKVGAPPVNPGHQTRYTPEGLSVKFEGDEFDSEIVYKEPHKNQNQGNQRKKSNQHKQQHGDNEYN